MTRKTPASFEVHELGGGRSNITFDYRILATRRGYEDIRLADKTKEFEYHGPARRPASLAPASVNSSLNKLPSVPVSQLASPPASPK